MTKRIFKWLALMALACTVNTVPAAASDQEVRQLKSKDSADLSSGKAYIVYDIVEGKFDVFFLRSMTEEELVQFADNRSAALIEERARLRKKRDGAPGVSDEELLPDEAFPFADENILNLVRLDSGRVFEKKDGVRTYVVEVPPGEYTVFGAGIDGFRSGTCMCMGSVKFEARSGEITDLGAVLIAAEDGKTSIPELAPFDSPEYIRRKALPFIMSVRPPVEGDSVPAKFAEMPVRRVEYHAADKMPNFLGMLINRMPPIDGVLSYEGDKVIDVRMANVAATGLESSATGRVEEPAPPESSTPVDTFVEGEGATLP